MLKKLREPVNSLTHWAGAILALIGLVALLIVGWSTPAKIISLAIYGVSLVFLFSASATYHMVQVKDKALEVFRKIDHAAIYVLIAGTYTPFCVNAFDGFWKWGMLSIIWSLALIGIVVKIFIIRAPRWLNAGIYIVMGWLSMAAIGEMLDALPVWVLVWMLIGGITYTLGAVVYITKIFNFKPGVFGFHEVWHIFVLLAAAAHFVAVMGVALY
ncbi:MAG: hemolysin III family protein [Anaerolineales bacterium]|jgi:hemolysin III|nr:hemolysin III family protein [Chloroflexota bacterium]MBK6647165.1 hemolysin III family protein [Anaerolineales bacterium]MCC6986890.1 hemolysin III family protein [Anaerolineales bacterium]